MWKRILFVSAAALLLLLVVPVIVTRLADSEGRSLEGVQLSNLQFEEVAFRNDEQGIDLSGLLFVPPEGEGDYPGVVLIHGSGTSTRDNPWYLSLTAYLQERGVVVLLPDKRGSVGSGGDWRTSSLEDLAQDTVAAVDYLNEQEIVPISDVGVIGLSQGGMVAPIVPTLTDDVDFIVNVVGSSLPLYEVLHFEETNNLREIGILPGFSDLIAYPSTFVLRKFTQSEFWEAVGNFDPLAYWARLEIPALVYYGAEDTNVPAEASRARLESLDKDNIMLRVFEGSGHALEDPVGTGNRFFREDALAGIVEFIEGQARQPTTFAQPEFKFQGDDPGIPFVTNHPSSLIDNKYINPGAVLYHDGAFHMFFNSFSKWPGVVEVGYMTSEDGYTWRSAQEEPVFVSDQVPFGEGMADVSSVVVLEGGTWVLYFHTIRDGEIGIATARSPLGPWDVDPRPILRPGPEGAWDDRAVAWPSVIQRAGTFRMYYGGQGSKGTAIGLATSKDGLEWTKHNDPETSSDELSESDPVLRADVDWELIKVDRPRVTHSDVGWVMIYQGGPNVAARGLALSKNGVEWEKFPQNPFMDSGDFPIPNARTWDTALLFHDGSYFYWMEIGSQGGTDLYLAKQDGSLLGENG